VAFLELDGLTKRFQGDSAVDRLSLSLERGEVLALLGPSGSGKTTTLRLLAGFESPDRGRVVLEGHDVTQLAPVARRFGMVFQHYALFPHLDVGANVAFGLESRGVRGADLVRRVAEALALVDLAGFERRPVASLSGGQQQRVALARALAPEPSVLLLDEPLSNLDPALRERTRRELRALVHRLGITAIVVTHEQEDAFDLGDRIALLRLGHLEQLGTADELYAAPATAFVASFIGRASELPARVRSGDTAQVEDVTWPVRWAGPGHPTPGAPARLLARPEGLRLADPAPTRLTGTVTNRRFTGAVAYFSVECDSGSVVEVAGAPAAAREGDRVGLEPTGMGLHLFPAAS
jgi:putative spermidine/putrescine transport system ATP-binding protein